MNKFRFTINALAIAIFMLAFASFAQAQATRTWVSGVGDDVNPCSRTAPCKTFAGAISKTAVNGEIDVLDPGGFGAVTINKGLTIDGTTGSGFGSILATGAAAGIIINDSGTVGNDLGKINIRNLNINGTGGSGGAASGGQQGIRIVSTASQLSISIENCTISQFTTGNSQGIRDERATAGNLLSIIDCKITGNASHGISLIGAGIKAAINRTESSHNGGAGLVVTGGAQATAGNCVFSNNPANAGVETDSAASKVDLENCVISGNQTGILIQTGANARISNNNIAQNGTGVNNSASTVRSFGNNKIDSNGTNVTGIILGPGTGGPSQL
jgi:parallel beta-helix repeat protein